MALCAMAPGLLGELSQLDRQDLGGAWACRRHLLWLAVQLLPEDSSAAEQCRRGQMLPVPRARPVAVALARPPFECPICESAGG